MIRELILDTETTGLSSENGDKIVEIGIVELNNHIPTKKYFHTYLNPEREVPEPAFKVHGLNYNFLKYKPLFASISDEMLEFIGEDKIIIHNSAFDLGFLNNELSLAKKTLIKPSQIIDTLTLARELFPGSPASLDALCRRYSINNSNRDLHGALLDSYLLAQVYLELIGGSQPNFELHNSKKDNYKNSTTDDDIDPKIFYQNKIFMSHLTEEEKRKHKEFIININGLNKWSIYS